MSNHDLVNLIQSMSDDQCKDWMRFKDNKEILKKYWEQNYPDISLSNIGEVLYIIKYNISPLCQYNNHKKFKQFPKGYYGTCVNNKCICFSEYKSNITKEYMNSLSDEQKKELINKTKSTLIERYGVDNPTYMTDHREKTIKTNLEKYGVEYALQSTEIREKAKQTNLEKYGVDHYTKTKEYHDRVKQTNLEKYGVEYCISSDIVREKSTQTMIEKYGVDNYFKLNDNIKESFKEKYGVENPGQLHLNSETYNILQNPELFATYIKDRNFEGAASILNISAFTVAAYARKYDLTSIMKIGYGSHKQNEIVDWLKSLNIDVEINTRKIISPLEIDIYLPKYNLAIEYNGIFHHTELSGNKDKNYHLTKYERCKEQNIDLIQICSTVYDKKEILIKNMILNKLGMNSKIYARNTKIVEVSYSDSVTFLDENHLQNSDTTGSIRLGLSYNDELVCLMTFGKLRKSMGSKNENNVYEVIRIATKNGFTVVGGLSKLFNYFINKYDPLKVISYTDLRYFNGNSLLKLGFVKKDNGRPGYWYTDYSKMYHRYKFRKSELVKKGHDSNLSEWEIMKNLGYDRLWDCGHAKFEYYRKEN